MAYKVIFDTLAIIGTDEKTGKPHIGNLSQGLQTIYTDIAIPSIEGAIIADLEAKQLVPVIKTIEYLPGKCLNSLLW